VEDQSTDVRAASERVAEHLRDAILRGNLSPRRQLDEHAEIFDSQP
jgi:DNA-binding GntR family transcriptional regulator